MNREYLPLQGPLVLCDIVRDIMTICDQYIPGAHSINGFISKPVIPKSNNNKKLETTRNKRLAHDLPFSSHARLSRSIVCRAASWSKKLCRSKMTSIHPLTCAGVLRRSFLKFQAPFLGF